MTGRPFIEGIKVPFAQMVSSFSIQTKEGLKTFHYLPWALGVALAGRPGQSVLPGDAGLVTEVFGGGVVCIAQEIGSRQQLTWLPILNGANQAMPIARITSRDVSDTINRCRAKSVAMVNGVGLSLYAKGEVNTAAFIRSLALKPDFDLMEVKPVMNSSPEKNGEYIDWPHAVAAARITDPTFHWEVLTTEHVNPATGELRQRPYLSMGTGWGVAVNVTYKGGSHTEYLPIMGFAEVDTRGGKKKLDHQPLLNPNAHDWNRSVMRCLVKAIAFASGYGLATYAKSELAALQTEPLPCTVPDEASKAVPDEARDDPAEKAALIERLASGLSEAGQDEASMLSWLGVQPEAGLAAATVQQLMAGIQAIGTPAQAPATPAAPAAPSRGRKASPASAAVKHTADLL